MLLLIAIVYGIALRVLHTLTRFMMLDGGIGVVLGLYICAHPAANAVNMLFFRAPHFAPGSLRLVYNLLAGAKPTGPTGGMGGARPTGGMGGARPTGGMGAS